MHQAESSRQGALYIYMSAHLYGKGKFPGTCRACGLSEGGTQAYSGPSALVPVSANIVQLIQFSFSKYLLAFVCISINSCESGFINNSCPNMELCALSP